MQKTKKAFAKRFKVTASGKILRHVSGRRHLMRYKSSRQLKASGKSRTLGAGMAAQVKYAIAAGL
ncbi:MAG: 50S ribosomal protein L35 [Puniceicoccales bacterium]|jgi:large subunit ribosomal protein L35|nr:50S ribosomal protein L35 [Puniceicoccales bacterium]